MESNKKFSNSHAVSPHQPGPIDPVEQELQLLGLPLTRENWLDFAYPFGLPEEWTQELQNELPPQLQKDLTTPSSSKIP